MYTYYENTEMTLERRTTGAASYLLLRLRNSQ